jgi:hypothetical protein
VAKKRNKTNETISINFGLCAFAAEMEAFTGQLMVKLGAGKN